MLYSTVVLRTTKVVGPKVGLTGGGDGGEREGERIRATFSPRWLGYLTILLLYRLNGQIYISAKNENQKFRRSERTAGYTWQREEREAELRFCESVRRNRKETNVEQRQKGKSEERGANWREREILQTQANRQYMCVYMPA